MLQEANLDLKRQIGERRQAEEALKEARQQLANIIDFLPDATFVTNNEGEVIAWNKAIEDMTGVKASDICGKGNYEYALPFYGERRPVLIDLVIKQQEETLSQYSNRVTRATGIVGEAYMPALGGGKRYLCGTASVLRDSIGNTVGAVESIRDITERKNAEEEIGRLNKLYDLLSQANQCVVRVQTREELLPEVCRLIVQRGAIDLAWIGWLDPPTSHIDPVAHFGTHHQILSHTDFYTDRRREGHGNPGRAIREGQASFCNRCGDDACLYPSEKALGKFGFQSCGSFPLRFQGQVCGVLTVCVSEGDFFGKREIELLEEVAMAVSFALDTIESNRQKELAEQALSESEERFRLAMDATSDGLWDWDLVSGNCYYSPGYFRMLGYKPGELPARADTWLELVHPEDREKALDRK